MKEQTKIRIGALIAAILLAGLCLAFGQVSKTKIHVPEDDGTIDTIILKNNIKTISFSPQNAPMDTIKLSIGGYYSMSDKYHKFTITAKFPKTIVGKDYLINIDTQAGRLTLEQGAFQPRDNKVIYYLTDKESSDLSKYGYDLICFSSDRAIRPTTYQTRQNYFVDFFVDYYKQ